jgi:uncharacterized protein (TIGR02611 family)
VSEATEPPERPRREPPKLVRKLQERRETHKDRHVVVRAAFVGIGVVLVLGGLVMLVAPGPAFVVIPIGLAILSLEFAWAGHLLDSSLAKADDAKRKAQAASRTQKLLTAAATACAIVAAVVVVILYDLPGPL